VPRFDARAPVDVTVFRAGVPDTMPGRSLNVCERGVAAMLAGELVAGEVVGIEMRLPLVSNPLRARAMVRYQDKLRCGLEFLGLTAEQRGAIREWTKDAKTDPDVTGPPTTMSRPTPVLEQALTKPVIWKNVTTPDLASLPVRSDHRKPKRRGVARISFPALLAFLVLAAFSAGAFWWKWNREWTALESGLRTQDAALSDKPQAQVPAEVMEKLLVHRVQPAYPAEARKENLQGIIALDIVVGRDGSVLSARPLNGPEVLARAAADALRWWKFDPYRLNGQPAVAETTLAVEFKR